MVYNLEWSKGALCLGMPTNLFFDDYEEDSKIAKHVDSFCMSCPLQRECLSVGVGRRESGVWGGIYLQEGQIHEDCNAHKTKDDWSKLWLRLTTQMQ